MIFFSNKFQKYLNFWSNTSTVSLLYPHSYIRFFSARTMKDISIQYFICCENFSVIHTLPCNSYCRVLSFPYTSRLHKYKMNYSSLYIFAMLKSFDKINRCVFSMSGHYITANHLCVYKDLYNWPINILIYMINDIM